LNQHLFGGRPGYERKKGGKEQEGDSGSGNWKERVGGLKKNVCITRCPGKEVNFRIVVNHAEDADFVNPGTEVRTICPPVGGLKRRVTMGIT